MSKRFFAPILFVVFFCFPALAQEATPEVTPEPIEVVVVEEDAAVLGTLPDPTVAEEEISNTVTAVAGFIPVAVAIVFGVTALLKPLLPKIPSELIKLVVNLLVWGGYFASQYVGGADQFQSLLGMSLQILSLFVTIPVTGAGASYLHSKSAKQNIPLLGYQRTTPPL